MSDELELDIPEEDDKVEFIVDDEGEKEKENPEELKGKFEELQRERDALKQQADSVAALQKSFEGFGKSFNKVPEPPVPTYNPPAYDPKALDESIMNDLYTKPTQAFDAYFNQKMAPIIQEVLVKQASLNENMLKYDPDKRETYSKYKEEIDGEMKRISPYEKVNNPNYAMDVFDKVRARHMDEILEERIQKAVEERMKGIPTPTKTTFSESSSAPPPKKGKTIRLSSTQMAEAKRYCERNALSLDYYLNQKYGV
jgi:hypothetical protein